MKSMTGYGHSTYRSEAYVVECECKSYNNRYLDISCSLHPYLSSYEPYITDEVKKIASRGHFDITLKLRCLRSTSSITLDEGILSSYRSAMERIGEITGSPLPTVFEYSQMDGVIANDNRLDAGMWKEGVEACVTKALSDLLEARKRDGEGTKRDLEALGNRFRSSLDIVLGKKDEMEDYFRQVLLEKYEALLGDKGRDDPRFLSEVAALLVKYSINEECSRLKVHLREYDRLLSLDAPVGKQLDFLCQEMNREINTTASKSQMVEVNLAVVKMKDALEDIREQARNIE